MESDPILASLQISVETSHCRGLGPEWRGENYSDGVARLYCVEAGEAFVRHHGREFRMYPGALYLIPAHTPMTYWCPHHFVQHWVHFRATLFGSLDLFAHLPCAFEVAVAEISHVLDLLRRLESLHGCNDRASALASRGILLQLLAPFLCTVYAAEQARREQAILRLRPVLENVSRNLGQPLRVTDLAARVHLERTYFAHVFRQHMGISPTRYVQEKRIERARQLLWETELTLEAIAAQLGFSDAFHLSKTFKKVTRITPTAFRRLPRQVP